MPPPNRSGGRNVHIYDAQKPDAKALGGLILTPGITNQNFYDMIDIFITVPGNGGYTLRHNSREPGVGGAGVPRDEAPLLLGDYYVVTAAGVQVQVTDEAPLFRASSNSFRSRPYLLFSEAICARDQRCVIRGMKPVNPAAGIWIPLEAVHIFPVAYREQWDAGNLRRSITKPPPAEGGGTINSVQNGLLLNASMRQLFDSYFFAINPNDHYKIIFFDQDIDDVAGTYLRREFLDHPDRPTDEILEWYFRQAVLTNMKGEGEPVFEHDFPPGLDMIGEILGGVKAGERMQFELFTCLADVQDV